MLKTKYYCHLTPGILMVTRCPCLLKSIKITVTGQPVTCISIIYPPYQKHLPQNQHPALLTSWYSQTLHSLEDHLKGVRTTLRSRVCMVCPPGTGLEPLFWKPPVYVSVWVCAHEGPFRCPWRLEARDTGSP